MTEKTIKEWKLTQRYLKVKVDSYAKKVSAKTVNNGLLVLTPSISIFVRSFFFSSIKSKWIEQSDPCIHFAVLKEDFVN